ncbi:hypothetical protein D3C72_2207080 [compost metagenome]
MLAQEFVHAAIDDKLGNEAARDDGAFVDVEGYALQPGLLREVGGGFARGNAVAQQCFDFVALLPGDGHAFNAIELVKR